jgi:hypothetical protein
MRGNLLGLGLLAALAAPAPLMAAGDLAVRGTELPELVLGTDDLGFGISQNSYDLETGKLYQLTIKSTGKTEYAIVAPELFRNVWWRKVEAGGLEIKGFSFYEFEFEEEGEVELFFVPVRTGKFQLSARGLEQRGVVVTFNIK